MKGPSHLRCRDQIPSRESNLSRIGERPTRYQHPTICLAYILNGIDIERIYVDFKYQYLISVLCAANVRETRFIWYVNVLSHYLSIYLSICLFICLSVYLSIYLSAVIVYMSVCLSVCLSVCSSWYLSQSTCLLITFKNTIATKEERVTRLDANPCDVTTTGRAQSPTPPSEYMALVPSTRSWELKRTDINVIKIIGKGAFSRVAKATATGVRGVTGEITVAVKMLKGKCGTRVHIILY